MGVSASVLRRVLRARDLVHERFSDPLSLGELARAAGLSRFAFLRVFHDAFGSTPHRYLTRVRLEHARRALARRRKMARRLLAKSVLFQTMAFSALRASEPGNERAGFQ